LVSNLGRDIVEETTRAAIKLRNHGVEHGDVRPPNVLWNPECRKVMLVDFERSEILKQMLILQETSPNLKRKHLCSTDGASCNGGPHQRFSDSIGHQSQNIG
jgi:predicted Ser/Thr protein kinase